MAPQNLIGDKIQTYASMFPSLDVGNCVENSVQIPQAQDGEPVYFCSNCGDGPQVVVINPKCANCGH